MLPSSAASQPIEVHGDTVATPPPPEGVLVAASPPPPVSSEVLEPPAGTVPGLPLAPSQLATSARGKAVSVASATRNLTRLCSEMSLEADALVKQVFTLECELVQCDADKIQLRHDKRALTETQELLETQLHSASLAHELAIRRIKDLEVENEALKIRLSLVGGDGLDSAAFVDSLPFPHDAGDETMGSTQDALAASSWQLRDANMDSDMGPASPEY